MDKINVGEDSYHGFVTDRINPITGKRVGIAFDYNGQAAAVVDVEDDSEPEPEVKEDTSVDTTSNLL